MRTDGSLACWGYNGDGQATPPTPEPTPTPTATPDLTVDTDGDGCTADQEAYGAPYPNPGSTCTDPASCYSDSVWYDFYDVPAPALPDMTPNGPRNQVMDMADVLAVLLYAFTHDGGPPNGNGVAYDSIKGSCDYNGDTTPDEEGLCYDRSSSAEPDPPCDTAPPNGVIDMGDVLAVLFQFGLHCSGPP